MKITQFITVLLFFTATYSFALPTVGDAKSEIANSSLEIKNTNKNTPTIYNFKSRFDQKSSVSYDGQIIRLILIGALKTYMNSSNRATYQGSPAQALESLNSYLIYNSSNKSKSPGALSGFNRHMITAKNLKDENLDIKEGPILNSIYSKTPSKNLIEKLAGNDNPLINSELKGWSSQLVSDIDISTLDIDGEKDDFVEPEDLINGFFKVWANNASTESSFVVANGNLTPQRIDEAYITKDGLDLTQLTDKFLQGALVFSQLTNDYLNDQKLDSGLNVDNQIPAKDGAKNYTQLEHHWDEAFGYIGVAQDFAHYSDEDHKQSRSIDTNGDQLISIKSEKSLNGITKNASRFDFITAELCKNNPEQKCSGLTLSEDIINSALEGRHLISTRPQFYNRALKSHASIIKSATEKTIAVTVIHYLNWTLEQMNKYGTKEYNFKNHAKFWSEMKGYALAFQFNPHSKLSLQQFITLHDLMADKPVLMTGSSKQTSNYMLNLLKARKILQQAYGLSDFFTENL